MSLPLIVLALSVLSAIIVLIPTMLDKSEF
jgi:hypothetical protein